MNFKNIRITILLLMLAYIGLDTFLSNARATNWKHPLRVVIYPINADGSEQADKYIASLHEEQFDDIEETLQKEATRYGVKLSTPLQINLSKQLHALPPPLPHNGSTLSIMRWSLSFRFWSWKEDNYEGITPHIRAYALFHDPKKHSSLEHSTGLKNGKIALIKLFADKHNASHNNVVVLHELLHTLGATDKYDLHSGYPIYPDGFAEPQQKPLYPQRLAEIMGGRTPLTKTKAEIPVNLTKVIIGSKTATEIGW